MPYDINATLERLEQNLKDLDSARKQVENTVNASNELRQTVSDYVESITNLRNEIIEWEEQLKQSQEGLSTQVQAAFTTLKAACDTISAGFKSSTDKTLSKFSEQNTILTERVKELNTLRQELKSAMSEITTIKYTLEKLTTVLTESQQGQDQALANIIGKVAELPVTVKGYTDDVVQQMEERHRAFSQKLEDAISKADAALQKLDSLMGACSKVQTTCDNIKGSVDDVKTAVTALNDSLSKSININRWILIAGIITLAILHFI